MNPLFGFLFGLGWAEVLVIGVIAVLLFGRRLPDMAKYLGKSVVEFKKGIGGLENTFEDIANPTAAQNPTAAPVESIRPPQRVAPAAPKFDDVPTNTQISANPPQP